MATSVYIAGRMRGIKDFNCHAFNAAEERLKADFDSVFNPVRLDEARGLTLEGTSGCEDELGIDHSGLIEIIRQDIEAIFQCTHIYMLKGWENSTGAKAEKAVAEWLGLEVMYE